MHPYFKQTLTVSALFVLTGCAALGVMETSDPRQKIRDAYMLMNDQCRPIPAERLIGEALTLYQANNDEIGMAEAYHTYGNLYKFDCYHGEHEQYLLQTVGTHEKAYQLPRENFQKAAHLYLKHRDFVGVSKSYFGIANVYSIQGNKEKACGLYDDSLKSWNRAKSEDPNARMRIFTGFKDFSEMIDAFKRKTGC